MDANRLVNLTLAAITQDFGANNFVPEHIFPLIPTGIKALQEKLLAENSAKLENFRTEHIVPYDGVSKTADLTAASNVGLRIDLIDQAKIRATLDETPQVVQEVQLTRSFNRYQNPGIQDGLITLGWLEGYKLHLRNKSTILTVTVRGITCPQVVTNLSNELEADMVMVLALLAKQISRERRRDVDVSEAKS